MNTDQTSTTGSKTLNIAFEGDIPENYDEYLGPIFFEPYALDIAKRIRKLQPTTILELACGTGRVTNHLHAAGTPDAKVTATDLNPAMLEVAKRNVTAPNITWGVADAGALPYEANSYDALVCQFGIMFVPDRVKAYSEARRVLKPGGTMIVSAWDTVETNSIALTMQRRITKFFDGNSPKFWAIPFSYFDEAVMRSDVRQAGFTDVSIETVSLEGTSPSANAAATGLLQGNPVVGEIKAQGPDALPKLIEQLTEDIKAEFGDHDLKLPLRAKIITAKKS